ncbi:MAG: DUF4173 domain-containing protein, partial [Urechidicola sp.]|nr:DUF4173 domain-containing protein [Urechidicola sp.]
LVIIIAFKNFYYSSNFGFTYKRIGVFVYLLLTFIGLVTTYIKVSSIKNLWYLFRVNLKIAFLILIFSSLINWDKIITIHNIEHAKVLDTQYLIDLSDNNTLILKEYQDKGKIIYDYDIENKYEDYILKLNQNSWQEMVVDNLKTR